jgi:hypothetical protein
MMSPRAGDVSRMKVIDVITTVTVSDVVLFSRDVMDDVEDDASLANVMDAYTLK